MKRKLSLFLIFYFVATSTFAQAPDMMSYQAVVRNANGTLISEKPVGIRISILQKTDVGNSVYIETHTANTNKNGLVTIKIGGGTVVSGSISKVDWSKGPYFLQAEIDPAGGNAYSISNVSQMLSVPYALYAKSSGNNGWGLQGNAISANDYIGTTNEQPMTFKLNNVRVGHLDNNYNIFWGLDAGIKNEGTSNVGIGHKSLYANKAGFNNTANGDLSLSNNTDGNSNVANGFASLLSNTSGYDNTAIGVYSLAGNTTGYSNSANGFSSLYSNTMGDNNSANGYNSLYSNTTGVNNSANGYNSLYSNTTGIANTATGSESLYSNTTGIENTADGAQSLYNNTVGDHNTAIGNGADVSTGGLDNATALANIPFELKKAWSRSRGIG